jgi:glutaconate CoA-transferase, subunit B
VNPSGQRRAAETEAPSRADALVCALARELVDGDVVATGVSSPLALLAIGVAKATHAPRCIWLACVGAVDPPMRGLHPSTEDLAYLEGRRAELTIADLFDHARRGRVDVVFFGAAEVDGEGATNMSAGGALSAPSPKFPGVAGAASLRRWTHRPVLVMPRHSRRCLVPTVQVRSTRDDRRTPLLTDLGRFEVGPGGARLEALHTGVDQAEIDAATGFSFARASPLGVIPPPDAASLAALAALDPTRQRDSLVPERRCSP